VRCGLFRFVWELSGVLLQLPKKKRGVPSIAIVDQASC